MNVSEWVGLVGTKSTDERLVEWFAQHDLARPPKSVTANQGRKSIKDKARGMEHHFAFDIINDRFYPPVALKSGSLECYLQAISLYAYSPKGSAVLPEGFWSGWVGPGSSLEHCLAFFDGQFEDYDDTYLFRRAVGDVAELKLWFSLKKQQVETIDVRLVEDRQFLGAYDFDPENIHNTTKQAATLLVKWLFDDRHLLLDDGVYQRGLEDDHEAILRFVHGHLNGHVWKSQLADDRALRDVLSHTQTSRRLVLKDGETLELFAQHLHLKAAGVWEAYQRVYNDDTLDDWSGAVAEFERGVVLTSAQRKYFREMLGDAYRKVKADIG